MVMRYRPIQNSKLVSTAPMPLWKKVNVFAPRETLVQEATRASIGRTIQVYGTDAYLKLALWMMVRHYGYRFALTWTAHTKAKLLCWHTICIRCLVVGTKSRERISMQQQAVRGWKSVIKLTGVC